MATNDISKGNAQTIAEPALRKPILGDVIELFRDPETETLSDGFAFVWAIVSEDEQFYELQVSYCGDPAGQGRKFTRKYRKYPVN